MSKNRNHVPATDTRVGAIRAAKMGWEDLSLPEDSRHGRVARVAHKWARKLAERRAAAEARREAKEAQQRVERFNELSVNAKGLNQEVLSTISEVAHAGLPGLSADKILSTGLRIEGHTYTVHKGLTFNFGKPRFFENEDETPSGRVVDSDIALLEENAPVFSISSPEAPRLGKPVTVRNMTILYEATLPPEVRDKYPEPGKTTIWINQLSSEERERSGDVHPLGAGYSIVIGADGVISYIGADTHGGGYEEIKSSLGAEEKVRQLLRGLVGAAEAVAPPQIPDSPASLMGPAGQ